MSGGLSKLTIVDYDGSAAGLLQRAPATIGLRLDELFETSLCSRIDLCGRIGLGLGRADHGHVDR